MLGCLSRVHGGKASGAYRQSDGFASRTLCAGAAAAQHATAIQLTGNAGVACVGKFTLL
jgi:hypothetical protein